MNNPILHCENLNKKIGKKEIINNVSFDIYAGDIVGFIGMNGAGKTTIIKLLLNLQHKDSGKVIINGYDVDKDYINAIKNIGAIIENPEFYNKMSGRRNLKIKSQMYKITDDKIDEIIELVGLKDRIDDKVSKYSLGMKQRLGIALAIINNPKLLILDEPTNGLDLEGFEMLRNILKKLQEKGTAILISSHILSELDNICNKVFIIKNGKIIDKRNNEIDNINMGNIRYIFEVSNTENINLLFDNVILSNTTFEVNCNKEFIPLIIESLVKNKINIYSVFPKLKTLEDILIETSGGMHD